MSEHQEMEARGAVVVCDGATVPTEFRERGWNVVPVRSHGPESELNLRADSLGTRYIGRLDERAVDLVRIAAFVFAADQLLSRGGKGDPNRRHWRRELAICAPVSDPSFWSDEDTTTALSEALGYGTEDRWEFAFSPAPDEDRNLQLAFEVDARRILAEPDCVSLLSGGIDSLCATVEAVAAQQRRPVLVSHRTAPHVAAPQRRLVRGLEAHFPAWALPHLNFWIHRRGKEAVERTRRTRGFLIAALGAAVAGQVHLPTVLLADNGYVSVNPPVNAQLVGALNSRGTHPTFLRLVNRLLELVFPFGVQLENPLQNRTRAEALALLAEHRCEHLLRETHSCSKSRQPADKPHCGVCSQCVDRRFATVAAELEAFDPPDEYGVDIFTAPLPPGEPRVFAMSYVGHAQKVDALSAEAVFLEYPELEACLDLEGGNITTSAESLAGVLKRHADEVLRVIGVMVGRNSDAIARNKLPETCLLRAAIDSVRGERYDGIDDVTEEFPISSHGDLPLDVGDDDRPQFEKYGRSWWVVFGSEKALIDHSLGMQRLARLLKAPGQQVAAQDLVAWSSPRSRARKRGTGDDAALGDGMRATGDAGDIIDAEAIKNYRRRVEELEAELADLTSPHDEFRRIEARYELEALMDQLKSAVGKAGKTRKVPSERERARQTVSQTIATALAAIEQQMPDLRLHLGHSLHLGFDCSYDPKPRLDWDVLL
jgi:hypothetical protein